MVMLVEKRNGKLEEVSFDKIIHRIKAKCLEMPICDKVDYVLVSQQVVARIFDGVKTTQLDELTAQILISMSTLEPQYGDLASRIIISNNHKNTYKTFKLVIEKLDNVSDILRQTVIKYGDLIEERIDYKRDYLISYFGYKVLENGYLKKIDDKIIERPQHLWMRVALAIHMSKDLTIDELNLAFESYDLYSKKYMTQATPTLFNAGNTNPNMLSCFLIGNMDDSIKGIYKTISDCADISKSAGGLGINIHNIRSKGSVIKGSNGKAQGLIPMMRVFNDTALYVNQCFHPNTAIYTKNGVKRACDVNIGDNVITLDGSYKPVLQVVKNEVNKQLLNIKTNYSFKPTRCTPEHQIYCIQTPDTKLSVRSILELNLQAKYINAGDLKSGDLVVFTTPKNYSIIDDITDKYLKFYGLWLIAGFDGKNYMSINTNLKKEMDPVRDFVKEYLDSVGVKYEERSKMHKKTHKICWSSNIFRDNDRNRTCINDKYFSLNIELTSAIIDGILFSLIRKTNLTNKNTNIKVENYNLVLELKCLFLKIGKLVKGYKNGQNKWIINVANHNDGDYVVVDNLIWTRIKKIDRDDYKGLVYDFNILDNHNYLTDIGIVHNSGSRNGSFAMYCEPSHPDFMDFLEIKKNHGNEANRCRDLFYAVWMPDLFMKRLEKGEMWSFMDPLECPNLNNLYGDEYEKLYLEYENAKKYRFRMSTSDIWHKILESQIETGTPYICYKDAINKKTNHKHLGTIKTSNLCAEIAEYSDEKEYACCTLASIGLPAFINENSEFDYVLLSKVVDTTVRNLNKIIDINYYPVSETEISNLKHRPIGIGIQGLADVYMKLRLPFDSLMASIVNKKIFATIYWSALNTSLKLAKEFSNTKPINKWDIDARENRLKSGETYLGAYSSFSGSPLSNGQFQFDMWNAKPLDSVEGINFDWEYLRSEIMKYGVRNSLLVAPMPTASTSQILGYNECFEPITSNIYTRNVLAGEFIVVNKYLIEDLQKLGIWNKTMKDLIILNDGSIKNITQIPQNIRDLYKTSYDLSMKTLIDQAADRGIYVCQTQSLNLFMANPTFAKLTSMHLYSWQKGLKTGIYYLRTKSVGKAQQFTIDPNLEKNIKKIENTSIRACKRDNPSCLMCSS